ncbi:MAG: ribulose-phosphate 3-epimerase [Chloroflexi bacterium]|nr:MAG: ribulose-phosphate 3-epimerase [Chloroflexota bacterium]
MAARSGRGRPVKRQIEIVPSILSADLTRLGEQVRAAAEGGADRIQVDVMDGHFVPNLTFGPGVVAAVRSVTDLPIEAHLMVERPDLFIQSFARAGATVIIVQVEATSSLPSSPNKIRRLREVAPDVEIEVDGGIDPETVPLVVAAGATVLVAGSAVYGRKQGVAAAIKALRDAANTASAGTRT